MTAKEAKIRAISRHIDSLKEKHRVIDEKIDAANSSFMDFAELRKMKVERLQFKQEISWLEHEIEVLKEEADK